MLDIRQKHAFPELNRGCISDSGGQTRPVMQTLCVDFLEDADAALRAIHLGFQSGVYFMRGSLNDLQTPGLNHDALNLRFNRANMETTLKRLSDDLLPEFAT